MGSASKTLAKYFYHFKYLPTEVCTIKQHREFIEKLNQVDELRWGTGTKEQYGHSSTRKKPGNNRKRPLLPLDSPLVARPSFISCYIS